MIYFIQNDCNRRVAIGLTCSLRSRFASLLGETKSPLSFLGAMCGGFDLVTEIQQRFESCRVGGDWFVGGGELADFIRTNATIRLVPAPRG